MNNLLTYEEFKEKYTVNIGDDVKRALAALHGVDAEAEIEAAIRREYADYLALQSGTN